MGVLSSSHSSGIVVSMQSKDTPSSCLRNMPLPEMSKSTQRNVKEAPSANVMSGVSENCPLMTGRSSLPPILNVPMSKDTPEGMKMGSVISMVKRPGYMSGGVGLFAKE